MNETFVNLLEMYIESIEERIGWLDRKREDLVIDEDVVTYINAYGKSNTFTVSFRPTLDPTEYDPAIYRLPDILLGSPGLGKSFIP